MDSQKFNCVCVQDAVTLLNEATHADRETMQELIEHRIVCNLDLAYHPTIQVNDKLEVGLLGIINGIFGLNASLEGYVRAVYQDDILVRFEVNK